MLGCVLGFAQVCAIGGEQYEGIRDDLPKIDRLQNRTNEDSEQVRKISGKCSGEFGTIQASS